MGFLAAVVRGALVVAKTSSSSSSNLAGAAVANRCLDLPRARDLDGGGIGSS